MVYNPDQSNNVYIQNCTEGGGIGQHFEHDPLTGEIKQDGLCLDIITTAEDSATLGNLIAIGNTLMRPCNGKISQQWSHVIDRNQIKSKTPNTPCLTIEVDGNLIGDTCLLGIEDKWPQNQTFLVPESWTLAQQTVPVSSNPYISHHISPAIWSSDLCVVNWLKNVMKTCDDSMALLLGSSTSLGTLRAIAKLVNNKGPERMPGTCCLDSPLTSQFFGYHYNPATMKCQNPGPWHLGISAGACENAGGRWFRSPCVTLKECIDQRPKNGTDHFSPSFEDFARNLVIKDPSNEARCMEVREELGFESNHPFDTEVCEKFESHMCDGFFTEVDELVEDLSNVPDFQGATYNKIEYPNDPELPFDPLPERTGQYNAFQVPEFGTKASLNSMQDAVIGLKHQVMVSNEVWEFVNGVDKCAAVENIPLPFGGTIPLKTICETINLTVKAGVYTMRTAYVVAFDIVSSVYEKGTLGPSDQIDEELRIRTMFDNFQSFDMWNTVSLQTINKNIKAQHTEMRKQLQDRHTSMEDNINKFTETVQTALGEYTDTASQKLADGHETLKEILQDQVLKVVNDTYSILQSMSSDVASLKSTGFNVVNNERDLMKNEPDGIYSASVEVMKNREVPKISCGFDVSLSSLVSSLTMNVAVGDNTTLFVKEDMSQSAGAIPLVLLAEGNRTTDLSITVTVRSNSAIAGRKTVALFYRSSSAQLVPYVLPLTCSKLNSDICDQSGDDFILYEFSFVAIDQTGNQDHPVICNVIVHPPTMKTSTQTSAKAINSIVRYDLLPNATFPLAIG